MERDSLNTNLILKMKRPRSPPAALMSILSPDQDIIACQLSKQLGNEAAVGTVTKGNGRHRRDFHHQLQRASETHLITLKFCCHTFKDNVD